MLLGSTEASRGHGMMNFVGVRVVDRDFVDLEISALISATVTCNLYLRWARHASRHS